MRQVVLGWLCMVAGVVVVQQVWGTSTTVAAVCEALYVAGFVIRMLFLVVLMLAGAGLLSVVGANMLG